MWWWWLRRPWNCAWPGWWKTGECHGRMPWPGLRPRPATPKRTAAADVVIVNDSSRQRAVDQLDALWHGRLLPFAANLAAGVPAGDNGCRAGGAGSHGSCNARRRRPTLCGSKHALGHPAPVVEQTGPASRSGVGAAAGLEFRVVPRQPATLTGWRSDWPVRASSRAHPAAGGWDRQIPGRAGSGGACGRQRILKRCGPHQGCGPQRNCSSYGLTLAQETVWPLIVTDSAPSWQAWARLSGQVWKATAITMPMMMLATMATMLMMMATRAKVFL